MMEWWNEFTACKWPHIHVWRYAMLIDISSGLMEIDFYKRTRLLHLNISNALLLLSSFTDFLVHTWLLFIQRMLFIQRLSFQPEMISWKLIKTLKKIDIDLLVGKRFQLRLEYSSYDFRLHAPTTALSRVTL